MFTQIYLQKLFYVSLFESIIASTFAFGWNENGTLYRCSFSLTLNTFVGVVKLEFHFWKVPTQVLRRRNSHDK